MRSLGYCVAFAVFCFLLSCSPLGIERPGQISYNESSPLTKAEQEQLSGINSFAFELARVIQKDSGNNSFVFSPLNMACELGMLSEGAGGETRSEICKALGFGENGQEDINAFCKKLLVVSSSSESEECELEIANAAAINRGNGFLVINHYKEIIESSYEAVVVNNNFHEESIAQYINYWAEYKTHGKIQSLLDSSVNYSDYSAFFVSSLFLKAPWNIPFQQTITQYENFTSMSGQRRVRMMRNFAFGGYYETRSFRAVSLALGRMRKYVMTFILPKKNSTVNKVLQSMDGDIWSKIVLSFSNYKPLDVKIPSFNVETEIDLLKLLKDCGIKSISDPLKADFSRITNKNMSVEMIKHKAKVSVNEAGVEIVSATDDGMMSGPPIKQIQFLCDSSFVFAISEMSSGTMLHLGVYR